MLKEEEMMKLQNNQFLSIEQLQAKYFTQSKQSRTGGEADGVSFYDLLNRTAENADRASGVRFSKHATTIYFQCYKNNLKLKH